MFDFNFSTVRPTCFAADNQLKKSAGPRSNGFLLAGILAALGASRCVRNVLRFCEARVGQWNAKTKMRPLRRDGAGLKNVVSGW